LLLFATSIRVEAKPLRERCPKTGKVMHKPDECAECEYLLVTIPAGWACTYSSKAKGARLG